MTKYFIALTLLIISLPLNAQHWTRERFKAELQKQEFLNNPDIVSTLERVFDIQEELGGFRLMGVKTSAQVAQEYYKNVYFDFLTDLTYPKSEQNPEVLKTDEGMQQFLDNQVQGVLNGLVDRTIRNFADWAMEKYGVKYPKSNLTDEQAEANARKVPDGIYLKTKNKSAWKDSFDYLIDPYYEIVCNGKAYRLEAYTKDFETGYFNFYIYPTDFRVLHCDSNGFQSVWINDRPSYVRFAYDSEVIDFFEPAKNEATQAIYNMFSNIESVGKKDNNRFIGVWRCVDGFVNCEQNNTCKVFDTDSRILVHYNEHDGDIKFDGTCMNCEYLSDEYIIEGSDTNKVDWIDDNTYTLTWKSGSNTITNKWVRGQLPDRLVSFIRNSMWDKVKTEPTALNPREMLSMLDGMLDMPKKWNGYKKILNMTEADSPEDWGLKATALMRMACMQSRNNKRDKAVQLLKQAADVVAGHETDYNAEAMYVCYNVHYHNAFKFNRNHYLNFDRSHLYDKVSLQKCCEELEMALYCLEEFSHLAPKEADKWKKEIDDIDDNLASLSYLMLLINTNIGEYKKAILSGNKTLQAWNRLSEEYKNGHLYEKNLVLSKMLESARCSDNTAVFEKCANELSAFLADVSEKYQKHEVSMDEDTRDYILFFCENLIEEYGKLHDYDRSEEYASLAMTFAPEERSKINYLLCKSLIYNERYEEANQLHTILLKDNKFVKRYLQSGDEVAMSLKKYLQPKEVKVKESAPAVDKIKDEATRSKVEAQKKINAQLASVNQEMKPSQEGDSHVKIKGYTASSTNMAQAKKDSNGRVALPVDSAKKVGVGIHVKF